MTRLLATTLLAAVIAAPAYADVTLKQKVNGKGMGMAAATTGATFIKGHKMPSDVQLGDKVQTTIFDLDAQKMYVFDSKKKEADVWDMAAFAAELSKSVDTQSMHEGFAQAERAVENDCGAQTATVTRSAVSLRVWET